MAAPAPLPPLPAQGPHGDWVRLRTLILLRYAAILGQTGALVAAVVLWRAAIDLPVALAVVGALMAANLVAIFVFPQNKRLSEIETLATLLFDLVQLGLLLALTGGLTNPFAVLVLVPVTISATALNTRSALVLGVATVGMVTLLALFAPPLAFADGSRLDLPPLYRAGLWAALVIGAGFLGLYAHRVAIESRSMADALVATQMALAREQKLTDLGGVVAAAAHELGTPLATITLVSAEMADELEGAAREDALLIRAQANRCRDILRSMGQAGKDDLHLRSAPLSAVLEEAAAPHRDRGREVRIDCAPGPQGEPREPQIRRAPELIHALRNLVQNAVDFARGTVWIDAHWSAAHLVVRISDDGPGYPPGVIGRIGDPFLNRRGEDRARPGYEGMGLGLFIAKTLLERTGARIVFANGPGGTAPRGGAGVEVTWPLERIAVVHSGGLGENVPISG